MTAKELEISDKTTKLCFFLKKTFFNNFNLFFSNPSIFTTSFPPSWAIDSEVEVSRSELLESIAQLPFTAILTEGGVGTRDEGGDKEGEGEERGVGLGLGVGLLPKLTEGWLVWFVWLGFGFGVGVLEPVRGVFSGFEESSRVIC